MNEITELAGRIARLTDSDGIHATPVPRLALIRTSAPTEPMHALHQPALCIVAQGRKQVMLGDRVYRYGGAQYLIVTVDLPVIGQVIEATPEEPYLCVRLDLDAKQLAALILDMNMPGALAGGQRLALALSDTTRELADAVLRLVRLLDRPADIPVLAPLFEREILYHLLLGEQAPRLRAIALGDSHTHQVNRAIGWIKSNFTQAFSIELVATEARMSVSSLHQHFKDVTGLSPLQYQKQLRLQEARRLILSRAYDAASAGHQVGYDSPSQFSREYSRLFGAPPLKDVIRLRDAPERYADA